MVRKHRSKIVSLENSIPGVYTLELTSLDKPFKYNPGQFLHLAVDSDYDGIGQWPESRCFSMRSNADEENIRITYSVKGHFTRVMETNLEIGSEVWLKLPYGNLFTQSHNKVNTVFISGGTGITPFLSLFTHKSFCEYKNPHIYAGFRSKEYNIYNEEFINLCNPSLLMKFYYEDLEGQLNIRGIFEENGINCYYFISGPPEMIKLFKTYLIENKVEEELIRSDDWE